MRVLPDVAAIDKTFDYAVPDAVASQVRVGSVVRVDLHGRRVGGWVVADDVEPPAGVKLLPIAKVTGWGPAPDLMDLAPWAAWRWFGRRAAFVGTATADRAVTGLPRPAARPPPAAPAGPKPVVELCEEALALADREGVVILRLPPSADTFPLIAAAASQGDTLALVPSLAAAQHMGLRARRSGVPAAVEPKDWPAARAGCSLVVGARASAWAPVRDLSTVVVLDEHDEVYQEERAPTWHARDVVIERAARAGARVVLVSPMPTLEAQEAGLVLSPARAVERSGWPALDTVDLRHEDPTRGLLTDRLVAALRSGSRVVCVLNRKGRSRLLACVSCGELQRCESCDASVTQNDDKRFECSRCGLVRPAVCQKCGATRSKNLRAGVTRLREELEALVETTVVEVTGDRPTGSRTDSARIFVGTEAVLHQVPQADVVAFLDFDQELLAPRYRAAEQALALLVRAARLLGGRGGMAGRQGGGRLLVQTRLPHHEVIQAALLGDPTRVSVKERERRELLGFPPCVAMAAVSGAAAGAFIEAFGSPLGVDVLGPRDGMWLLRAPEHRTLCDALASTPRPAGRLRVEVDPLRI